MDSSSTTHQRLKVPCFATLTHSKFLVIYLICLYYRPPRKFGTSMCLYTGGRGCYDVTSSVLATPPLGQHLFPYGQQLPPLLRWKSWQYASSWNAFLFNIISCLLSNSTNLFIFELIYLIKSTNQTC